LRVNAEVEEIAIPDVNDRKLLTEAAEHTLLSARRYHQFLRVTQTLLDFDNGGSIRRLQIAEALSYRCIAPHR
jgi:magnesium chelatase family protein